MSTSEKVFLLAIVFLIDLVFFVVPIEFFFLGYILFFRPRWFRDWVLALYAGR